MTFFGGNSSRPVTGRAADEEDRGGKSETTFLGEAADLPDRAPAGSRNLLDNEAKIEPMPMRPMAPATPAGPTPPDRCANVIASGAKWQGTLTVDDSVRIEGNFSGEIRSKGTVHVSEGAQVDAKVRAAFVVVSGNFRGEIRCEQRVDLMPRSRVTGEVITKVLSVHEGAILDGRVQMTAGSGEGTETQAATGRASRAAAAVGESGASERRERATANGLPRNAE
jgi:cytoskeletal protein CcmA (bactofilin family)